MIVFCNPKRVLRLADLEPHMKVLELGCGAGRITFSLSEVLLTGSVLGVDFQRGMLSIFQRRLMKSNQSNISCATLDLTHDDLPKGEFDRVIIVTVLGEIPNYQRVLKNSLKVLKENGRISITEVLPDPCYIFSKTLLKDCIKVGFEHVKTERNLVSYTMTLKKPMV